jgi:hypothetical protein
VGYNICQVYILEPGGSVPTADRYPRLSEPRHYNVADNDGVQLHPAGKIGVEHNPGIGVGAGAGTREVDIRNGKADRVVGIQAGPGARQNCGRAPPYEETTIGLPAEPWVLLVKYSVPLKLLPP